LSIWIEKKFGESAGREKRGSKAKKFDSYLKRGRPGSSETALIQNADHQDGLGAKPRRMPSPKEKCKKALLGTMGRGRARMRRLVLGEK